MASTEKPVKSAEAFRTISEVSDILDVPQHVLRFWEGKFSQIKPMKRGGNRRYYRPEDLELLRAISHLLYTDGYTIKGVQKLLRENGVRATVNTHVAQFGAFQGEGGAALEDAELADSDAPADDDRVLEVQDAVPPEDGDGGAAENGEDLEPVLELEQPAGENPPEEEAVKAPVLADTQAVIAELKSIRDILTPQ